MLMALWSLVLCVGTVARKSKIGVRSPPPDAFPQVTIPSCSIVDSLGLADDVVDVG